MSVIDGPGVKLTRMLVPYISLNNCSKRRAPRLPPSVLSLQEKLSSCSPASCAAASSRRTSGECAAGADGATPPAAAPVVAGTEGAAWQPVKSSASAIAAALRILKIALVLVCTPEV